MSWYTRMLSLFGFSQRALPAPAAAPVSDTQREAAEDTHQAGHDYAGFPAAHGYEAITAMAAQGRFAWVFATVARSSADLSRLPWVVRQGRGRSSEKLDHHPMIQLLEQPNTQEPGTLFWRQIYQDRKLTGVAYVRKVRAPNGTWISSVRLHPASVRPQPGPHGFPDSYLYLHGGVSIELDRRDVIAFRGPSWQDDPRHLQGQGVIEPLHRDLRTDWSLQERSRRAADQGRPSGIISPSAKDGAAAFTTKDVTAMREELGQLFHNETGGVVTLGRPIEYTKLDWSSEEMEVLEQRRHAREAVLAVTGVPPVRCGLETANYATAQQQAETYWGDELQAESALFDDVLTMHARIEFGPSDVTVQRSFADVPALQGFREAALRRASQHILNGMDPAKAYADEGLEDVAFEDTPTSAAHGEDPAAPQASAVASVTPDTAVADTALNGAQIASLVEIIGLVGAGTVTTDGAVALIQVSFPTISAEKAKTLVAGAVPLAQQPTPNVTPAPTPPAPAARGLHLVGDDDAWWSGSPIAVTRDVRGVSVEAQRAARWRRFIAQLHGPIEGKLRRTVAGFLRTQADRVAERVPGALGVQRNIADELASVLMPNDEDAQLREAVRKLIEDALDRAFGFSAEQVDTSLAWQASFRDSVVEQQLGQLVTRVSGTTRDRIGALARQAITEGWTASDLQARLQADHAFSPARALTIARTETTKATSAGSVAAFQDAVKVGAQVDLEWLAAGDARDAHKVLDGQVQPEGTSFTIPSGSFAGKVARYPGDFGIPALDINCRCAVAPRVRR